MLLTEYFLAAVIVVGLVVLAVYFAWRQWQALRAARQERDLPQEERGYHRHQTWRRLLCSALMLVFAGMLAAWYLFGLNKQLGAQATNGGPLTEEQRRVLNWSLIYWIAASLVLGGIVFLAALDLAAIYKMRLRLWRQLQADRREMIAQELARYRSERNGHK